MGKAAAAQGRWSQAAMAYDKALKTDPSNARIRAQRGQALFRSGNADGAEGELRQAAAGGAVMAHKVLGHIAAQRGDASGAVAHYQTYLRTGPRDKAEIKKRIAKLTN
jgi:cytochrome c-type biogenesis protein CcmH/NrfG